MSHDPPARPASPAPPTPQLPTPLEALRGTLAPAIAEELPGLVLLWTALAAGTGPSSAGQRLRLRTIADRGRGADVIALRSRPVPRAYRALYRQLGLDPDHQRIPAEATEIRRLLEGGLEPGERIADACRLALLETAVPVWALDAAVVDTATFGLRLADGTLQVADAHRVHAPLFGDPEPPVAPSARTRRIVVYAVLAPGVPELHGREALWLTAEALEGL